jgi:hypothetical protein
MRRLNVSGILDCSELDGKPIPVGTPFSKRPTVTVSSHWNQNSFVRLTIDLGDGTVGHEVTVSSHDLERAVQNARNT